ncbi:MAG TPA: glycine cleavage T C-terminal barrel domain-containing protein [Bryobacteraceae bacterium]|jgi:aminomethyltransferase|nr:glycine cleavage T C-terminal barrel domain-containing protein [Bryobacteraceae bacterium]
MNGYEQLRESAAWIDTSNYGEIRATGEDRARLLNAMATNDIKSLDPGEGCYSFFLNAQGRILGDAVIFNLGESLLIHTEPETRPKLQEHIEKYIIADDVTLSDETEQWATIGLEGPESAEKLKAISATLPNRDFGVALWGGGFVAKISATGAPGYRMFCPATQHSHLVDTLKTAGLEQADGEAMNIVRLEHGKPRYGVDITERYLTQETNQMHAVSFSKGCYLGQEIVERVRSRAQIHRVLTSVRVNCRVAPVPGTKLKVDGKDVAEITSAAFSPALNEVVALAYVRVEQVQAKSEMVVDNTMPIRTAYIP